MSCPSDELLRKATLGESSGDVEASLQRHVQGCSDCRARVEALALAATIDSQRTLQREGPPSDSVVPGQTVGPYVVSRRLGAGAMGAVYAAWDPRLEREVALKVLHVDLGDLVSEARLLARLSHPNVVTVHEVMPWNGRLVLVMERVQGLTLRQWLADEPRPLPTVLEVFSQCAAGLAAAHAAGIVHRDFKPDNALVDTSGRARLLDFGLAMPDVGKAAVAGTVAGSPAYLGLAQLEGAPADASSDQYAWWVSLYEALAGRLPHDGASLAGLVVALRRGEVNLAPLPAWLRPHVARGLSNDPAARFSSMDAAAQALVRPRRRALLALGALGLAALVGGSVALTRPSPCSALSFAPDRLAARAKDPALREAVREYAGGVEVCRALSPAAQAEHAACLEQTGRELDLALEVLETDASIAEALRPRVLRRVRPASRCAREPRPLVTLPTPAQRPALLASHRAQLRFDGLRATSDAEAVLRFASQHRQEAAATGVPGALAWAHLNEAAALSALGRVRDAVLVLRALESVPGLGLREQTWGALGAWLFECYSSSEEECLTQQKRALRLAQELDEPWANAMRGEVALRYLEDSGTVEDSVEAWVALPGAGPEARRALANELAGLVVGDQRLRIQRGLAAARRLEPLEGRLQELVWQLDLLVALREGDVAKAEDHLRKLEAVARDAHGQRAFFEAKLAVLSNTRRYREALEFAAGVEAPESDSRFRYRAILLRVMLLHELHDPGLAEERRRLELVLPVLAQDELAWVNGALARMALMEGDVAALERLKVPIGDELLRAWHLAVLRGDRGAQDELLARAAAAEPKDEVGRRLRVEGLLEAGRWAEAAEAASRLRAELEGIDLEFQVRLLEAWARWQLGQRDEACRVMNLAVFSAQLLPRERERGELLVKECPRVGLSSGVERPP